MEFVKLFILLLGGIAGGFYGAAVGGGGLFTLPLLLLLGLSPHLALGTQRFAAAMLEISSSLKFHTAKKINFKIALPMGILAGTGSFIGANIALAINEKYLNLIIAILLVVVFLVLVNKDSFGVKEHVLKNRHYIMLAILTFLLGLYGGFFGAGFGVFISILFVIFGFKFIESAAISRVIGSFMSLIGMIVFAWHGLINYYFALSLGIGFAIGSLIGIQFALKKGDGYVRNLLMVIIVITAAKLILDYFNIKIF